MVHVKLKQLGRLYCTRNFYRKFKSILQILKPVQTYYPRSKTKILTLKYASE